MIKQAISSAWECHRPAAEFGGYRFESIVTHESQAHLDSLERSRITSHRIHRGGNSIGVRSLAEAWPAAHRGYLVRPGPQGTEARERLPATVEDVSHLWLATECRAETAEHYREP